MTRSAANLAVSQHFYRRNVATTAITASKFEPTEKLGLSYRFWVAYQNWKANTECLSDIEAVTSDPAFSEIVEIGRPALPYIIRKLREERSFIFLAAIKILGEDPVHGAELGSVSEVIDGWIAWAEHERIAPQQVF